MKVKDKLIDAIQNLKVCEFLRHPVNPFHPGRISAPREELPPLLADQVVTVIPAGSHDGDVVSPSDRQWPLVCHQTPPLLRIELMG